jgi:hypothetical protein
MPSVARAANRGSLGDPIGRRDPHCLPISDEMMVRIAGERVYL